MGKIRKYQNGNVLWTPNYSGIQGSFGKYGLMQSSLLGDWSSLKTPGNFKLQMPNLGSGITTNSSAIGGDKPIDGGTLDPIMVTAQRASKLPDLVGGGYKPLDPNSIKLAKSSTPTTPTATAAGSTMKGGVSNMSSGLQSGLSAGAGMIGGIGAGMNKQLDPNVLQAREQIRGAISKMGPWGAIIGAATSVVDMIGDATGLGLDSLDKNAAERAGLKGAAAANNFLAAGPGVGLFAGMAAGKTQKGEKSEMIDEYRNAYSGSAGDIDAGVALGGKRTVFGKRKANRFIEGANQKNSLITSIGQENNLRKSSSYGQELASQNYNRYMGKNAGSGMVVGKLGMKFPALEDARKILEKFQVNNTPEIIEIEKFAEGGKMNVIAHGALHCRKNHLDEVHEDLSDITPKGIPVVSLEEGGEIVQHAEIEGGELILTKELTSKLEELYRDGSEEAMIEAGKLLAEEIVENTDDKTNTILDNEDND